MKTNGKILSNQRGMSLIEVIVAAAISVIISGAVMQTNQTGIQGVTTVSTKISLQMWQSTVLLNQLSNPTACLNNLTAGGVGGYSRANILDQNGVAIATNQQEITGTGGDWMLGDPDNPGVNPVVFEAFVEDTAGATKGRCDLTVTVSNQRKAFGAKTINLKIPVSCTTNVGQTQIEACSTTMDASDNVWQLVLGNGGNIPEHISSGLTRSVLIGLEDEVDGSADDVTAPFQINNVAGIEFPSTGGSGIYPAQRILGEDHALVWDEVALFENSDCFEIAHDNAGVIVRGNKICRNSMILNNPDTGVVASGNMATAISSMNVTASGMRSLIVGSGYSVASGASSIILGSGYANSIASSSTVIGSVYSNANANNSTAIGSNFATATGTSSAVIASTGTGPTTGGRASAANSVVLGASNVAVNGSYSIGTGSDNIVTGTNSFATGENNSAGTYSLVAGSNNTAGNSGFAAGTNADATGWNSFAFGQDSEISGDGSAGIGQNVYVQSNRSQGFGTNIDFVDTSSSYSHAIGTDLRNSGTRSLVLGSGASSATRAELGADRTMLAMFDNGFQFKTNSADQWNTLHGIYISSNAQLGIGADIDATSTASFVSYAETSVKPKLYVQGHAEITGSLWVGGTKVGGEDSGWLNATMPSGGSGYWTSTLQCRYINGIVHLRGAINKTGTVNLSSSQRYLAALPSVCMPRVNGVKLVVTRCDGTQRNILLNQLGAVRAGQLRPTNEVWGGSFGDDNWFGMGTSTATNPIGGAATCYIFFDGFSYLRDR